VLSLTRSDGVYVVKAGSEALEAGQVVVATGPFHGPFVPPDAKDLDAEMTQIHSVSYRGPQSLPAGKVLVVGAANSGCQIALELSGTHAVELSAGKRIPTIPQRPLGRDVWWWASKIGLDRVTVDSRLGRRLAGRDQVIEIGPRQLADRHGVRIRPRATMATGRSVTFADGSAAEFDAVVWATGFKADHAWIDLPGVRDEQGRILHQRGVTPSPGLYMLSRPRRPSRAARSHVCAATADRPSSLSKSAHNHSRYVEAVRQLARTSHLGCCLGAIQAASPLGFWWLDVATVYALSLVLIASVYIGLAVADGRPTVIAVESSIAGVFVVVAAAGVTGPAWLLVLGLAGHGFKDLWQHRSHYVAKTRWWPPFCLVVDWVAAAVIAVEIATGVRFHP
jgi:hypothetical protein